MDVLIGLAPLWVLLFGFLVSTASVKLGARLAGAEATWPRAFLAIIILYPTGMFVTFVSSLLLTPPVGLLVGLVAVLVVIKVLFSATWPQTLVIWILMTLAQVILLAGALFLTGLGIQELMKHLEEFRPGGELEIGLGRLRIGLR